ncbi:hypothetical protein LLG46_13645 [bacterium]|nr:hypothetical protein [bacterium]
MALAVVLLVASPHGVLSTGKHKQEKKEKIARKVYITNDPVSAGVFNELTKAVISSTKNLEDLSFQVKIVKSNPKVLQKLKNDFMPLKGMRRASVWYKPPKIKVEVKVGSMTLTEKSDGIKRSLSVRPLRYKKNESSDERESASLLDAYFGLLTENIWQNYVVKSASRAQDGRSENCTVCFSLGNKTSGSHNCVIDMSDMKLLKINQYDSSGVLQAKYVYSDHKRYCDGFWVPRHIDIYNAKSELAASVEYVDIKVNAGIRDSIF